MLDKEKKEKILGCMYVGIYIFIMVIMFFVNDVEIVKDTINKNEKLTDIMDIYGINKTVLVKADVDFTAQEMELIDYVRENSIKFENKNTLILANPRQEYWIYALFGYTGKESVESLIKQEDVIKWNNKETKYLLVFNRSIYNDLYGRFIDKEGREKIFENESGFIVKNY